MAKFDLSIIIPVYNAAETLDRCIKSIIKQTIGENIEIIIINDGSTDDSVEVCKKYVDVDSRIKVISKCNEGVAVARNIGLDNANGEYISWIDSDDYVCDGWFQTIKEAMESEYDLIFFDYNIVTDKMNRTKRYRRKTSDIKLFDFCYDLVVGKIPSHLWSKVFKKKYWDNIRFGNDISYCEDYSIMHEIVVLVGKIRYIHEALYNYCQRENSIVNDVDRLINNTLLAIELAKKRKEFLEDKGFRVSNIGEYLAIDIFLWSCHKVARVDEEMKKKYDTYLQVLKTNMLECLFSTKVEWRKKVQIILLVTGAVKFFKKWR